MALQERWNVCSVLIKGFIFIMHATLHTSNQGWPNLSGVVASSGSVDLPSCCLESSYNHEAPCANIAVLFTLVEHSLASSRVGPT